MTTKELQELCDALRNTHPSRVLSAKAAEVIEYLVSKIDHLERDMITPETMEQALNVVLERRGFQTNKADQ